MIRLGSVPKQLKSVDGDVVTRFPPENSGCLHIGHLKAIVLNRGFADMFNGKMLVRIDDTNPAKEEDVFEKAIFEDLDTLGVKYDGVSHTSDHFEFLIQTATDLVRKGLAYVDTTPADEMSKIRTQKQKSVCRDQTPELNEQLWRHMQTGDLDNAVLRLKMQYDSSNGSLRDPVAFRIIDQPHNRSKDRFRIYPTYDFSCPIVDSVEGVTHTMRTNEYTDRDPQYRQILKMLCMRCPVLYCYGRIEFEGVEMSKRKIKKGVQEGVLTGWDDFRLPTIKGVLKAGVAKRSLFEYFSGTGFSKNTVKTTWDKFFATNRKIIDKIAGRCMWVSDPVKMTVLDHESETVKIPLFFRNPDLGDRDLIRSSTVIVDRSSFDAVEDGEEVTLMNWGNMIVDKEAKTLTKKLDGDVKSTKNKLVWVPEQACRKITVVKDVGEFKPPVRYDLIIETGVNTDYVQLLRSGYLYNNGEFWVELRT